MAITSEQSKILKREFPPQTICIKPQSLSKDKRWAMLVLYAQHTDIADRIEEVDPSWAFEVIGDAPGRETEQVFVSARLTILGVARCNYGEGKDHKGACSDAFKRCAMLFGVGRYLHDAERVWVPYDIDRDKFREWTYADYSAALKSPPKAETRSSLPAPSGPLSIVKNTQGRVLPDRSLFGNGIQHDGVVIPYGPLAKQFVHQADPVKLREYVNAIEAKAKNNNTPIPEWAVPVIQAAESVIGQFENRQFEDKIGDCCG